MEIIPIAFGYLQGIMAGLTNNLLIFPFPLFGSRIHFMTRQNIDMTFSLLRNLMVGLKNTLIFAMQMCAENPRYQFI